MTKRQERWTTIGDAFATPVEERTERQEFVTRYGLCDAVDRVTRGRRSYTRILDEIAALDGREPISTWLPMRKGLVSAVSWTPYCDSVRANFAYLMAALSDEEYAELIGG